MTKIRTYSQLRRLDTFEERFDYLCLDGQVGVSTFGFDRYLNQQFYMSNEWQHARREVILRDQGCDLGVPGYEINDSLLVHHINPIISDDILHGEQWIIDPEYLITTTNVTHNAIHFGNRSNLKVPFVERSPRDTNLW
jgi:hypothetical protein